MSEAATWKALSAYLNAPRWAAAGLPPLFAANQPGERPAEYVVWSLRPANTQATTVGADEEETVGILYFQHFVAEGTGEMKAKEAADRMKPLLNFKTLAVAGGGAVRLQSVNLTYVGVRDAKLQHSITVRYEYDGPAARAA